MTRFAGIRGFVSHVWSYFRKEQEQTPLREFVYLDETSVYSLLASRRESLDVEMTNIQRNTHRKETSVSGGSSVKVVNLKGTGRDVEVSGKESQVVSQVYIQNRFRQLREGEKERMPIWYSDSAAWEDDITDVRYLSEIPQLANHSTEDSHLVVDTAKLTRGTLLEARVRLQTEATFQVATVIQSLTKISAAMPE